MRPAITSGAKAKQGQVQDIIDHLKADLDADEKLGAQKTKQLLEQLKVHTRSPEGSEPIYTQDGIKTLCRYAFDLGSEDAGLAQEALRCIANTMLLAPKTRQALVDLGYAPKAAEKLKHDNIDDEFLLSRILFLLTYDTDVKFDDLIDKHQLAENINEALYRHSKRYSELKRRPSIEQMQLKPMDVMALSETLKLLFNITHFYPDMAEKFSKSIPYIFKLLLRWKIPTPPLEPPINYLINAVLNLDLEDTKGQQVKFHGMNAVFPTLEEKANAEHLINILDNAIVAYKEPELDNAVSPVLTLIRRMYEIAPSTVKKYMEWLLLPNDDERERPLGKSDTLSSRLLNLSTSAMSPSLRGSISAMMFELSGKDANKFVQNVGFGFAAGFLASNNIQMPDSATDAHATAGPSSDIPINPITGQRLDREEPDTSTPMTEAEKLREAERLFVAFERLKATGVMNVQNPVEEAYRSGRIQELPSDDEEEED